MQANCAEVILPSLSLPLAYVKCSLRCILHTLLFCRQKGPAVSLSDAELPQGILSCGIGMFGGSDTLQLVTAEPLSIAFFKCGDEEAEREIESKVVAFTKMLERGPCDTAQLSLSFYHLRPRERVLGLFQPPDEKVFFERWVLSVSLVLHENLGPASRFSAARKLDIRELPVCTTVRGAKTTRAEDVSRVYSADVQIPTDRQTCAGSEGLAVLSGVCTPAAHRRVGQDLSEIDGTYKPPTGSVFSSRGEASSAPISPFLMCTLPPSKVACLGTSSLPSRLTEPASSGFCSEGQSTTHSAGFLEENARESELLMAYPVPHNHDPFKQNERRQQILTLGRNSDTSNDKEEMRGVVNLTGDYIRELSHVEKQEFEQRVSPANSYPVSLSSSGSFTQGRRIARSLTGVEHSIGGTNASGAVKPIRRGESTSVLRGQISTTNGSSGSFLSEKHLAETRVGGLLSPSIASALDSPRSQVAGGSAHGRLTCFHQHSETLREEEEPQRVPECQNRAKDYVHVQIAGVSSTNMVPTDIGAEQEHDQGSGCNWFQSTAVQGDLILEGSLGERLNDTDHTRELGRRGKQTKHVSRFSSSSWMLQEERAAQRCVERAVRQVMMKVIQVTTEKQWHLPPPFHGSPCEGSMYRFEINFSGPSAVSVDQGWHINLPAALRTAYSRHMPYLT
ncbi:hypothetical protein TGPRC2_273790 [Toxoplasma gondii TgCatPRC2]|uniref:Autophagy-related protein 101 n=2 Tax=Toxoplasma gondii TaxID=5811 RepID=A0A151HPV2_TOXGO|nr:hypothetical protein TGARI_273790 [Toxoplasma gondii ARI]KYK71383.1 hypothetical protein TGPRC2_273790 [Toxoplasma gondii TgCatPRC2]